MGLFAFHFHISPDQMLHMRISDLIRLADAAEQINEANKGSK